MLINILTNHPEVYMTRSAYLDTHEERHVHKVEKNGLIVWLDDGSVWDISTGDNTKSICWYETMRIIVEENGSGMYPFTLTNLDTAGPDVVRASRR